MFGNGASLTAIKDGRSIDTTMGLTPTGGIMMATRSGDLDPGALLHLLGVEAYSANQLEDLVNRQAGLLAISGTSSDMRELLEASSTNANVRLAVEMFCYSAKKWWAQWPLPSAVLTYWFSRAGLGNMLHRCEPKFALGWSFWVSCWIRKRMRGTRR